MQILSGIPDWLGKAVLAAFFGALGYLGRELHSALKAKRAIRSSRRQRLEQLDALLQEQKALFLSQRGQAERLYESVLETQPAAAQPGLSLDQTFSAAYDSLSESQQQLHTIIRGVTATAVHRINAQLLEWLESDTWYKKQEHEIKQLDELSQYLRRLELHLNQWQSKYDSVFESDPKLALSYLADEQQHGTGFPTGIEERVKAALDVC